VASHGAVPVRKLAALHGSPNDGCASSASVPNPSDTPDVLSPVSRRDRFVFRQNHLEVLERLFAEDMYPVYERREQIAGLCNMSTEALCK